MVSSDFKIKTNRRRFRVSLREPFLAASHLWGAACGIVGTVFLVAECSTPARQIVATIYGLSLSLLFLISGLLHGCNCSKEREDFLERLDYVAIYIFIAATYTPFCLFMVGGRNGILILSFQWIMASAGVLCTLRWGFACKWIQITIFLLMGWMFLFIVGPIMTVLTAQGFNLLLTGAAFYSVGAFIFAYAPEYVCRGRISSHGIWHVFVLLGALSHYLMIAGFMAM